MNKNLWIIILVILILSIGGYFAYKYFYPKKNSNNIENVAQSNLRPELNCPNDWQGYYQDTLGIAFCYPKNWGNPILDPFENLTRINQMENDLKDQKIHNDNSINIIFENNKEIFIKIFNDTYYPLEVGKDRYDYYESGATEEVINLKKINDICEYKIGYEYDDSSVLSDTFRTIYSDCQKQVKTVLSESKQFYDFLNIGTKYTYDLKLLAFKKINNNFFDNVLITDNVDQARQINETLSSMDEFYNSSKTTDVEDGLPKKNIDLLNQDIKLFEQFVNSIVTYQPILRPVEDFKTIKNEDPNITSIRKFYWLIESGNLNDAFQILDIQNNISFDDFKKLNQNAYLVQPYDFKSLGDNTYEFYIKYQNHNQAPVVLHIITKVENGTLETTFEEQYLSDISEFNDMKAYAVKREDKNYLILNKNNEEIIIDKGDASYKDDDTNITNINDVKFFNEIKFSPNGNYLTYNTYGWEWGYGNIYDIFNKNTINNILSEGIFGSTDYSFSPDEKYLYKCSSSGMASGTDGKVYQVPDFEKVFDILDDSENEQFLTVKCQYNKQNNSIIFDLGYYGTSDKSLKDKTLKLEYKLNN